MLERTVEIPDGVTVSKEKNWLVVKGPKGELKREFLNTRIKVNIKDRKVMLSTDEHRRKIKAVLGTWEALVKNMVLGVTNGWRCDLKLVFSHFPAKLSLKDNELAIQNFLGERSSRTAKIPSDVNVKLDKENIIITGLDKQKVGLAGGKIERATKIVGFDRRVFQDGCYIVKKTHLIE